MQILPGCGDEWLVGGDPKTVHAFSCDKGGDPTTDHATFVNEGGDPRNRPRGLGRGGDPKTDHASLVVDDTESMAATCPPYRPGRLASATASVPTLCLSIFQFLAQLIPIS